MQDDPPPPPPPVSAKQELLRLREQLSECDQTLISALAERMHLIGEVARLKSAEKLPTFDREREGDHLDALVEGGGRKGLAADIVRDVFGTLFAASRRVQRREARGASEHYSFGILGGTAGMGAFLARVFEAEGHTVEVTGLERGAPAKEVASRHDFVVVAVPIDVTEDVIREVAPVVRVGSCLLDVTSVKSKPLAAMLAHAPDGVDVVGTHPMFGPSSTDFDRQKVVLCRGRGYESFARLRRLFEGFGAECIEATAEEHDAQMALIQVLIHEKTMVLGSVLERLRPDLSRSLQFASPIYRTELAMVGRMFSQGPELYADILTSNPDGARLSHVFEQEAAHFARAVSMGDRDAVLKRFREVADFMKEFATWAKKQSDGILNDLVKHG